MSHTQEKKEKILSRIKRLQVQLTGVANGIETEQECYKVLQTLASARGALQGLIGEIIERQGTKRDSVILGLSVADTHSVVVILIAANGIWFGNEAFTGNATI